MNANLEHMRAMCISEDLEELSGVVVNDCIISIFSTGRHYLCSIQQVLKFLPFFTSFSNLFFVQSFVPEPCLSYIETQINRNFQCDSDAVRSGKTEQYLKKTFPENSYACTKKLPRTFFSASKASNESCEILRRVYTLDLLQLVKRLLPENQRYRLLDSSENECPKKDVRNACDDKSNVEDRRAQALQDQKIVKSYSREVLELVS